MVPYAYWCTVRPTGTLYACWCIVCLLMHCMPIVWYTVCLLIHCMPVDTLYAYWCIVCPLIHCMPNDALYAHFWYTVCPLIHCMPIDTLHGYWYNVCLSFRLATVWRWSCVGQNFSPWQESSPKARRLRLEWVRLTQWHTTRQVMR